MVCISTLTEAIAKRVSENKRFEAFVKLRQACKPMFLNHSFRNENFAYIYSISLRDLMLSEPRRVTVISFGFLTSHAWLLSMFVVSDTGNVKALSH